MTKWTKAQMRNKRATDKRAATKSVLNADDSLHAVATATKEAVSTEVVLAATSTNMDGTLTSVRDIAPIGKTSTDPAGSNTDDIPDEAVASAATILLQPKPTSCSGG